MVAVIEEVSTLTSKGQTTLPKPVRQALGVNEGDPIRWRIEGDTVQVTSTAQDERDPLVDRFLAFIAKDIEAHPERVRPLDADFVSRLREATKGVKIDHDAPIAGAVDL